MPVIKRKGIYYTNVTLIRLQFTDILSTKTGQQGDYSGPVRSNRGFFRAAHDDQMLPLSRIQKESL